MNNDPYTRDEISGARVFAGEDLEKGNRVRMQ